MVAIRTVESLRVRVRTGDLAEGRLQPGAGLQILGRTRDMNLRGLARQLGAEGVKGGSPGVARPTDTGRNLRERQGQREAGGQRPEVSLAEVLRQAGVSEEKMEALAPEDLFAAMLTDADRADLFRTLEPADRATLLGALGTADRAALFGALDFADRAALFGVLSDADLAALFRALNPAGRAGLFRILDPVNRVALEKAVSQDSNLALALAIIEQGEHDLE